MSLNSSDLRIINNLRNGDIKAFDTLFDNYYELVHNVLYNRLKSFDLANEYAQEIFIDLWIKKEKISIDYSISSFFLKCAKHKIINHIRQESIRSRTDIVERILEEYYSESDPKMSVNNDAILESIEIEIEKLPINTKNIFKLSHIDNYTYQEIADYLGCSKKNVEYHVSKALQRLRLSLRSKESLDI